MGNNRIRRNFEINNLNNENFNSLIPDKYKTIGLIKAPNLINNKKKLLNNSKNSLYFRVNN